MDPNGPQWAPWAQMGPMGPNVPKWAQWTQMGPMGLLGPNGPKWAQWTQMDPNGPNGPKWGQWAQWASPSSARPQTEVFQSAPGNAPRRDQGGTKEASGGTQEASRGTTEHPRDTHTGHLGNAKVPENPVSDFDQLSGHRLW